MPAHVFNTYRYMSAMKQLLRNKKRPALRIRKENRNGNQEDGAESGTDGAGYRRKEKMDKRWKL